MGGKRGGSKSMTDAIVLAGGGEGEIEKNLELLTGPYLS